MTNHHYGATADETVWLVIRSTTYEWTPEGPNNTRSAWLPTVFQDYDRAEDFVIAMAETYGVPNREGQFTTFTIQEYAPIPF